MIWLDIIAFNMIDGIEFFYINGHIDRATPAVFLKGQASVIRSHLFCAWNAQRSVITNIYNLTFMLSAWLELMTWNAFVESCETSSAVCNIYRGRALPRCCSVRRRNEITIATSTGQVPRGFCSVLFSNHFHVCLALENQHRLKDQKSLSTSLLLEVCVVCFTY